MEEERRKARAYLESNCFSHLPAGSLLWGEIAKPSFNAGEKPQETRGGRSDLNDVAWDMPASSAPLSLLQLYFSPSGRTFCLH